MPGGVGEDSGGARRLTRRAVLRDGSVLALALFVARDGSAIAVASEPGAAGFLSADELRTLRAAVDRFVPEDRDPGAVAAGCAEAIDALLAAFRTDPPLIYAGAPFSDRGGSDVNHFLEFVPLDPYEEKGWRLRIEGSRGQAELEFNGAVKGWQATYRDGLAALDEVAAPARFADLPAPARDMALRSGDARIRALVNVAVPHTLQLMYGAPEYGGNRDLVGWDYTRYAGDVLPRGWTRAEIEDPDATGLPELLPRPPVAVPVEELIGLAALASPEAGHALLARGGESLDALRAELAPVARHVRSRRAR